MRKNLITVAGFVCALAPAGLLGAEQSGAKPPAASTQPAPVALRIEAGSVGGGASRAQAATATPAATGETLIRFNPKKAQ